MTLIPRIFLSSILKLMKYRMVSRYGPGALMAKFDVESTYQNIPFHSDERFLLGMKWHGQFYVDLSLPFGLRSAPVFFFQFCS